MIFDFKTISSLEKVFFDGLNDFPKQKSGSMLKNEIYSFQLSMSILEEGQERAECKIEIDSELKSKIKMYYVGSVPVMLPIYSITEDTDYLSKKPGLYPDVLNRIDNEFFTIYRNQTRSVWL